MAFVLLLFHFVVPFLLLLSRDLKRNARTLALLALVLFLLRFVDLFWLVGPDLAGHHGSPGAEHAGLGLPLSCAARPSGPRGGLGLGFRGRAQGPAAPARGRSRDPRAAGRPAGMEAHCVSAPGAPSNPDVQFEKEDVRATPVLKFLVGIAITSVVVCVLLLGFYRGMRSYVADLQPEPPHMKFEDQRQAPMPRLQERPALDLQENRAREDGSCRPTDGWTRAGASCAFPSPRRCGSWPKRVWGQRPRPPPRPETRPSEARGSVLVLVLWAMGVPARAQGSERPTILRDIGFDQKPGRAAAPRHRLSRRDGAARSASRDYFGKQARRAVARLLRLPDALHVTLNGLASALKELSLDAGNEFEVVTVSFDPEEGPELAAAKKKQYLERYKRPAAREGWHFLTGDAGAIERLTKAVGFRYAWDEATKQFAHPAGMVVLTPEGRIARYLFGIEYAPRDLRLALVEAAAGKIGTPIDQVVLSCYHYDPTTGRYGAAIMRMVRVGGVLTVLALGALRRRHAAPRARARPIATPGELGHVVRLPPLPRTGLDPGPRASTSSTSS